MSSWSYGMHYGSSGSDADNNNNNDADGGSAASRNAAAPSRGADDLYRLASLGSNGLRADAGDVDSAESRSPVQSPSQSRQQFVPIQLNLSQGSFTASAGLAVTNDDGGGSVWSSTLIAPDSVGLPRSGESSRVMSVLPVPRAQMPSVVAVPSVPATPRPTAAANTAEVGPAMPDHQADSGSTVLPELLSETARYPLRTPHMLTTPLSNDSRPPTVLRTAGRPARPTAAVVVPFPPVPSKPALEPQERSASSTTAHPAVRPLPIHSSSSSSATPTTPIAPEPTAPTAEVAIEETSPEEPQRRHHPTPLEILRVEQQADMVASQPVLPTKQVMEEVPKVPFVTSPPPLRAEYTEPPSLGQEDQEISVDAESAHIGTVAQVPPTGPPGPSSGSSPPSSSSTSPPTGSPSTLSAAATEEEHHKGERDEGDDGSRRLSVDRFFKGLSPVILQNDFRKTDIKRIACTAQYTLVQEMEEYEVALEKLALSALPKLEPTEDVCRAYEKLSRVRHRKRRKHDGATGETRVAPITTEDFCAPVVQYDRLLYAVCFSLWESLLPYNDIVNALTQRFFADVEAEADTDVLMCVPASVLFRWLNGYGVDVLVMSRDRHAASSFCTRRACLAKNGLNEGTHVAEDASPESVSRSVNPMNPALCELRPPAEARSSEASRRVLLALEFDACSNLWGPLTVSRAIRGTVAARDAQRRSVAHTRRRQGRKAAEDVMLTRRADRVRAKQEAWEAMLEALKRAPPQLEGGGERVATAARSHHDSKSHKRKKRGRTRDKNGGKSRHEEEAKEMLLVRLIGPRLPVDAQNDTATVPRFEAVSSSQQPNPVSTTQTSVPFADMVYPTVEPTDFGVGPVLSRAVSPTLPLTRLRLVLGVFWGLLSVVFAVAAVAYIATHLDTCVYNVTARQCLADVTIAGTSTCATTFLERLRTPFFARHMLFTDTTGLGNSLVVCSACAFAGLIACVLVAFFSTRAVVVKSLYPRFAYVVFVAHLTLCAIVCAFAAFSLSVVVAKLPRTLQCRFLPQVDVPWCEAQYAQCAGWQYQVVWPSPTARRVSVGLVSCLVACAALHLFSSFIPSMPSAAVQRKLLPAVPDTSGFQPSYFIPDGVLPQTAEQIQGQLVPYLSRSLQHSLNESSRMVTNTITVAEMMRENREQSIRMMELIKTRHRSGADGLGEVFPGQTSVAMRTPARRVPYLTVQDPDAARRAAAQREALLADVAVSPQLASRIRTVQASMHARLTAAAQIPDSDAAQSTTQLTRLDAKMSGQADVRLGRTSFDSRSDHDHTRCDAGERSSLGEDSEAETVWRAEKTSSASGSVPSARSPPHSPAEGVTAVFPERAPVAVLIQETKGDYTSAMDEETAASPVPASGPVQPSILTRPSVTTQRQAPTSAAFGGAPSIDRRADHHARTMRENISQIVRRLEQEREQAVFSSTHQ